MLNTFDFYVIKAISPRKRGLNKLKKALGISASITSVFDGYRSYPNGARYPKWSYELNLEFIDAVNPNASDIVNEKKKSYPEGDYNIHARYVVRD